MKILKIISLALAACIVIFAGVLYALPDRFRIEESQEIECSLDDVYPFVSSLKPWSTWSSFNYFADSTLGTHYNAVESGRGAYIEIYKGKSLYITLKIAEEIPGKLLKHEFIYGEPLSMVVISYIRFEVIGDKVKITWSQEGKKSDQPLQKFKTIFFEDELKQKMIFSLKVLKDRGEATKIARIGKKK